MIRGKLTFVVLFALVFLFDLARIGVFAAPVPVPIKESVTNGPLTMTMSCAQQFVSGRENLFQATLNNSGDVPIEYFSYNDLFDLRFEVKIRGRDVPPTSLYESWISTDVTIRLMPSRLEKGKDLQITVNFTRLFDLSVPDDYEITAIWSGTFAGTHTPATIKSAPIKVRVNGEPPKPKP